MRPLFCPECRVAIARGKCAKHPETVLVESLTYDAVRAAEYARADAFNASRLGTRIAAMPHRDRFDITPDGHPGFTLDSRGMFVLLEYVAELEARVFELENKPAPRGFFGEPLK